MNVYRMQRIGPASAPPIETGFCRASRGDPPILEAYRVVEELRAALSRDLAAARHCVEQLAGLLDAPRPPSTGDLVRGGLAPWQLRRVREHVTANLAEPLPIGRLSALVRLSASHFTRAFRASVGLSPHAFVMRERIERAKQLMLHSNAPICEIALNCGLADQAHMTRLFTRREGVSPAAWRRLHMTPAAAAAG